MMKGIKKMYDNVKLIQREIVSKQNEWQRMYNLLISGKLNLEKWVEKSKLIKNRLTELREKRRQLVDKFNIDLRFVNVTKTPRTRVWAYYEF